MSSYPKGDKSSSRRSSKPRKRKFQGNQFTSRSEKKLTTASTEVLIMEKDNEVKKRKSEKDLFSEEITKDQLVSLIIKCANFAAIKHSKQRRNNKEQTPYINHPIGVANILIEEGNVYDPAVIVAALLHDTVEDTDTTFEEIEECFGKKVRNIVVEVTDDKSLPKQERKRLQIEHAPQSSYEAKLVKLADKLYNLRDLEKEMPIGWTKERTDEYFKWAEAVVDGLKGANPKLEQLLSDMFLNHKSNNRI